MFDVIMTGLYEICYVVNSGMELSVAEELKSWLLNTCSKAYFDNLFITEVKVVPHGERG